MKKTLCCLACVLGATLSQGALVYHLPETLQLDGTKSGPSMDGNLIPEYPQGSTITAWVKPETSNYKHNEIFRVEAASNLRILFSFQNYYESLSFGTGKSQSSYSELKVTAQSGEFTDGRWHYVCAVYGGNKKSVWVDGVKRVEAEFGAMHVGRDALGYVGSSGGTAEYFKGGISDLQIHDAELTALDLMSRFAEGLVTRGSVWTWTGAADADWLTAANWLQDGASTTAAPNASSIAEIAAPAAVTLAADQNVGILRLTGSGTVSFSGARRLEALRGEVAPSVTLDLAEGAEVRFQKLTRGSETVFPGIYTGSGDFGTRVEWLSGKGILRIAHARTGTYPTVIPVAGTDGWYEFGQATGYAMGEMTGGALASGNRQYLRGERVVFDTLALPSNANVRLVGGLAADRIPCDVMGNLDVSGLRKLMLQEAAMPLADGSPFVLPASCDMYYTPGTLAYHEGSNCWYYASVASIPYDQPLQVNGTLQVVGNGNTVNPRVFAGTLTGGSGGKINVSNFGNAARLSAPFGFNGNMSGFQEGCAFWIDTAVVSGQVGTVTLGKSDFGGGLNASYSSNGLLFGKNDSDETADNPLRIKSLDGKAWTKVDAKGHMWRQGGCLVVWGGNTVQIGTLTSSLHVVADRKEQDCVSTLWASSYKCKGLGNIVVDEFKAGTLFASTNINVQIGSVAAGAAVAVDYTLQDGGVNARTLAFTGTCVTASVLASDLAMLPSRLSGFQGEVRLTNKVAKAYSMPIDFSKGKTGSYNPVGCEGSGALVEAPITSAIDVVIDPTGAVPEKGTYALARFTSGGELLDNWTVTINGTSATSLSMGNMTVALKRDATGIWLNVHKTGLFVICR